MDGLKVQEYSGRVDYDIIAEVKKAVGVPVIASGDILSPALAKEMLEKTGVDALLVARGALGNPWIFRDIIRFLKDGTLLPRRQVDEVAGLMKEHFQSCVDFYGERGAAVIFRKFFAWYTKGFRKVRVYRQKCCHAKNCKETLAVIEEFQRAHEKGNAGARLNAGG